MLRTKDLMSDTAAVLVLFMYGAVWRRPRDSTKVPASAHTCHHRLVDTDILSHSTSTHHNLHPLLLALATSCLTAKSLIISSLPPPTTIILRSRLICSITAPPLGPPF